jgi:two-component system, OmpR family, sensor histidine kinase KdpD
VNGAPIKRTLTVGAGYPLAGLIIVTLTAILIPLRDHLSVATSLSLYLLGVVATAAAAGRNPALVAAVVAPGVANWFLIPPLHTFRINRGENIIELAIFVSVAGIVSSFVSLAARRAEEAERAGRESRALSRLAELSLFDPVEQIVELIRETFGFTSVSLVSNDGHHDFSSGTHNDGDREGHVGMTTAHHVVRPDVVLITRGVDLDSDNRRLLRSFVAQLDKSIEQRDMHRLAMEAEALTRADELRTALLRSVSHDLRTPLASIKAAVSSLRQDDVEWPDDVEAEFLASIEGETDRLTRLITNLLDLGRLEAGVLSPIPRPTSVEAVIEAVAAEQPDSSRIIVVIPSDLPDVFVDAALVERALANLVGNALKYSPAGLNVTVEGRLSGGTVLLSVIDRGPGVPDAAKGVVVRPFHRLDDTRQAGGLGLGLAIADRMIAAVGGRLELHDTPGGGLTTTAVLPTTIAHRALKVEPSK